MRVFLDANVLFSAADAGSVTDQLLDRLNGVAGAVMVTSHLAIDEARRNVERKRFGTTQHLDTHLSRIEAFESVLFPLPVELAEKDRPILCAAIRAGCGLLATGDAKDFGHVYDQTIDGVKIVSLLELAKWIKAQG